MSARNGRTGRRWELRQSAAALAILVWISLASPTPAQAQSVGGACSVAAGSTILNNGLLLVCNGSTWTLGEGFASSGYVGIGTNTVNSMLDVAGDIRSETGTAAAGGSCSPNGATVAAAYSASGENLICTSGSWAVVASGSSGCTWHSTAFTTVGANTWTYPSGTVQAVWAFLVGGGGGGSASVGNTETGSGGGGGGISWAQIPATSSLTLYIGSGGTGGSNSTNGSNGGATYVEQSSAVLLQAGGGQGGMLTADTQGWFGIGGDGGVGNFGSAGSSAPIFPGDGSYAPNGNGHNGNGAAGGAGCLEDGGTANGGNSSFANGGSGSGFGGGGGGGASYGAGANGAPSNGTTGSSAGANTGGGGGGASTDDENFTGSGGNGGSGYAVIYACY